MAGWNWGDVLTFTMLCGSMVVIYFTFKPGSVLFNVVCNVPKGQPLNEKRLKFWRRMSMFGLLIYLIWAAIEIVLYLIEGK